MKFMKKLVFILASLMILVLTCTAGVFADNSKMDVVLVTDLSGSMKNTDENKVSLEGAKLFIDMMENSGSRVGLVAFTHKLEQVYNVTPMNSDADKDTVKNIIDGLAFDPNGDTDIGAAVQKAYELLESASDLGNKQMILLFTDGKIDLPKEANKAEAEEASRKLADATVKKAQKAGIPIYTIGLNANGGVDADLISKMASETGADCEIVKDAEKLPEIFNAIFANFVETEIEEIGTLEIVDPDQFVEKEFTIPNDSVLEANLVMMTSKANGLKEVELIKPDGSSISPDGSHIIWSKSVSYNNIKIVGPSAGTWTLRVKGDEGCKIHVNLLFNYDVILKAVGEDAGANCHVVATLEKNMAPVTDAALLSQLMTNAVVRREDNTETSYPMTLSGTQFECDVPLNPGETVTIYAHTQGANMYRDSTPFTFTSGMPVEDPLSVIQALPSPIVIKGLIPSMAKETINLSDYIKVADITNIVTYTSTIADPDIADAQTEQTRMTVKGVKRGTTRVHVVATDAQGYEIQLDADVIVEATFGSILPLILIPLGILLLILIIVLIILLKPKKLVGIITWKVRDGEGYETEPEEYDLVYGGTKVQVNQFVTETCVVSAGLDRVEITAAGKNGITVSNKNNDIRITDGMGAEKKKHIIRDSGRIIINCADDSGRPVVVTLNYRSDPNAVTFDGGGDDVFGSDPIGDMGGVFDDTDFGGGIGDGGAGTGGATGGDDPFGDFNFDDYNL